MDRREFLLHLSSCGLLASLGCRGTQHAHVLDQSEKDMVGSHTAGAETWEPLIQQTVAQLLGRQSVIVQTAGDAEFLPAKKRICFVGVENKSAEEIGDFKEQIYQKVDTCINDTDAFEVIHRKYVEAGLRQCGFRPEDLFVPNNRRLFTAAMEHLEQPFDFLMYANITSGTTRATRRTTSATTCSRWS